MAYIKFPSVSDAMWTLMRMHNHKMGTRWLRVSFSSKDAASFDAAQSNQNHGSHAGGNNGSYVAAASSSSSAPSSFDGQPSMPSSSSNGSGAQADGDAGMEQAASNE